LKLQPGETILIQGGAGGVASFAIQFAKQSAPV
jgi:NADPH:quinone reductase-like Zn-dependent oxidoreductase